MSQEPGSSPFKNYRNLASSPLRRQALSVARAGLLSIDTRQAVLRSLRYDPRRGLLRAGGREYRLSDFSRVLCVGFGKAANPAAAALQELLGGAITAGVFIGLKEESHGAIICRAGSHPYPSAANISATRELVELVSGCNERDLVICAVSGGGSALLCYPHELSCENEVAIIAALTARGADIGELNTVRKHISRVKGGQLAKLMYPATVIGLIFSDVPGDDLSMVASGPTVQDQTTARQGAAVLDKYGVLQSCGLPVCRLVETPKERKYFEKVSNVLAVSARQALAAMRHEAETLGWETEIFSDRFQGKAEELAGKICSACRPGRALLGAGESTVVAKGTGLGGRNQHLALAALPHLAANQVLLCLASDGRDNSEVAGAVVDQGTLLRARALGIDYAHFLENNDSLNFFESVGDGLVTGPTGSNVSDLFVCLRGEEG